jgi:hypothetical protein
LRRSQIKTGIEVEPILQRLVGERIGKGWRALVRQKIGPLETCRLARRPTALHLRPERFQHQRGNKYRPRMNYVRQLHFAVQQSQGANRFEPSSDPTAGLRHPEAEHQASPPGLKTEKPDGR